VGRGRRARSGPTRTYWPIIVINGSAALPTDGRGTLIVTGVLTFGGGDACHTRLAQIPNAWVDNWAAW
jgi:hypothetical protein